MQCRAKRPVLALPVSREDPESGKQPILTVRAQEVDELPASLRRANLGEYTWARAALAAANRINGDAVGVAVTAHGARREVLARILTV